LFSGKVLITKRIVGEDMTKKETDKQMKKPDIKLLCPPKKCGKCRRMITRLESVLKKHDISGAVDIVNDPDELQQYPTWILPTLVINGQVVARGYIPPAEVIMKYITRYSASEI